MRTERREEINRPPVPRWDRKRVHLLSGLHICKASRETPERHEGSAKPQQREESSMIRGQGPPNADFAQRNGHGLRNVRGVNRGEELQ